MDNKVLMRIMHCRTDLQEQQKPLLDCEPVHVAVEVRWLAIDVLHDEVRNSILVFTRIQQSCNVRVLEIGQNLTLMPEEPQAALGKRCAVQQFNGDFFAETVIGSMCAVYLSHPTASDLRVNSIGAKILAHKPGALTGISLRMAPRTCR